MAQDRPWSVPVRLEDVPETGLTMNLSADPNQRDQIAQVAGVLGLPRLDADFVVTRRGPGLHVAGEVSATVNQTCVVSLEPVENRVVESVDLVFAPAANGNPPSLALADADSEPPEPLHEGGIDLGAIATEFLLLGIDPYPRKPGAVFAPPAAAAVQDGPFAALASLKDKGRKGG